MINFVTYLRGTPYLGRGIVVGHDRAYYYFSTCSGDGEPPPAFTGEPLHVDLPEPEDVWAALNAENKVALYANVGGQETIFNQLGD